MGRRPRPKSSKAIDAYEGGALHTQFGVADLHLDKNGGRVSLTSRDPRLVVSKNGRRARGPAGAAAQLSVEFRRFSKQPIARINVYGRLIVIPHWEYVHPEQDKDDGQEVVYATQNFLLNENPSAGDLENTIAACWGICTKIADDKTKPQEERKIASEILEILETSDRKRGAMNKVRNAGHRLHCEIQGIKKPKRKSKPKPGQAANDRRQTSIRTLADP